MTDALVTELANAIHAEVKAWRLQTDGSGRYRAVKNGYSRELMGGPTREEAEAAFEALVDEQCARVAMAICAAKPHLLPTPSPEISNER